VTTVDGPAVGRGDERGGGATGDDQVGDVGRAVEGAGGPREGLGEVAAGTPGDGDIGAARRLVDGAPGHHQRLGRQPAVEGDRGGVVRIDVHRVEAAAGRAVEVVAIDGDEVLVPGVRVVDP